MSSKRYQFKLVEATDAAELETKLRDAGTQQWSAVGYGVLPDGRRSVLMERKTKEAKEAKPAKGTSSHPALASSPSPARRGADQLK